MSVLVHSGSRETPRACGVALARGATLDGMNFPFLGNWRKRSEEASGVVVAGTVRGGTDDVDAEGHGGDGGDEEATAAAGVAQLLSECELLRRHAEAAGLELVDSADSLAELDQLLPRWREDPEVVPWLGNDAGLYLGTVIVRTVPGARWRLTPQGPPVVELASGRWIDVVAAGRDWAESGTPELSQVYAEVTEA